MRSRVAQMHYASRPANGSGTCSAGGHHQGRAGRGHTVAGNRICRQGHPGERGVAGHHQDPDAPTHGFFATLHPKGRMGAVAEIVEAVLYLETAGLARLHQLSG